MATIQMVSRLDERRGLSLAQKVADDENVTAVCWWVDAEASRPRLLVGFSNYREVGPRAVVDQLSRAFIDIGAPDAPDFLDTDAVPSDDPRLQALVFHPWSTIPLHVPDLDYRFVNAWSHQAGSGQALVYFLRVGDEVRVPLPPAAPQAA